LHRAKPGAICGLRACFDEARESHVMTEEELLDILREEKPFLQEKFGLVSIGIFGSYAKGVETAESDIDLLVEIAEPRFDLLAGLQIYLENRLGKPVDLIRKRKNLHERFLRRIEKDILYV
jgi:predicted nucleotidyltransferase